MGTKQRRDFKMLAVKPEVYAAIKEAAERDGLKLYEYIMQAVESHERSKAYVQAAKAFQA